MLPRFAPFVKLAPPVPYHEAFVTRVYAIDATARVICTTNVAATAITTPVVGAASQRAAVFGSRDDGPTSQLTRSRPRTPHSTRAG